MDVKLGAAINVDLTGVEEHQLDLGVAHGLFERMMGGLFRR
jgi:hypothetical protein